MSAYTLGRLARVFASLGYIDKPEEGAVTYRHVLIGLPMLPYEGRSAAEEEAATLADALTPEEVAAGDIDWRIRSASLERDGYQHLRIGVFVERI